MQWSLLILAAVASAAPKAAPSDGAPPTPAPEGCRESLDSRFQLSIRSVDDQNQGIQQGQCNQEGTLVIKLQDGVLTDSQDRIGSIVANYQFQFDKPAQEDALFTSGFSVCSNGSLALRGSTVFYQCASGDFSNLYDRDWAEQCEPTALVIAPCDANVDLGGKTSSSTATGEVPLCQIDDGQIQAGRTGCAGAPAVSQIPSAPTGAPETPQTPGAPEAPVVSQIPDGQIQVPTETPKAPETPKTPGASEVPESPKTPESPVVSQIPDGQVQVPTEVPESPEAPVDSQIPDGQIQVPTDVHEAPKAPETSGAPQVPEAPKVSEVPQPPQTPEAPKAPLVSQIPDGQIQVPTEISAEAPTEVPAEAPVVSQISDGQIQVPTEVPIPTPVDTFVSQSSDGQIYEQTPTAVPTQETSPIGTPGAVPIGAGSMLSPERGVMFVAMLGAFFFL
ncbi:hypothetical protein S40293_07590 [Stachybotrys chartarum IBT 40293]|nr:hypothetical protein S40293_07590 [Stachybotrys chartarum IBT 40293]